MKKQKKNIDLVKCPECGEQAKLRMIYPELIGATFLASVPMIIISLIIFPPLALIWFILDMIALMLSPLTLIFRGYRIECKHCNSRFKLSKKEYKEMKYNN